VAGNVNNANNQNMAGVTITLSKPGLSETASRVTTSGGTNGNYFFTDIAQLDTYVVTPSLAGFTFTPASRTFTGQITLNVDFVAVPANPIEDSRTFVRQHYLDFFNREPDAGGWNFWTNNIDSCGGDAACREVKRIDTSAAYFLSIEFEQTGYLVHRFYRASFSRRPLFSEFLDDTRVIGNGVIVKAPGWEALLESNTQSFINSWINRPALTSIYNGLNNTQYVDRLIANTGVSFSQTERVALIDSLDKDTMTRAQVLRAIAQNEAFYNAEYNNAFVEMQYFGYLRRDPDEGGYDFWLGKLNSFNGDFRRAEMVKAFISSIEYRQRFGNP
jgi:hypothetical protein